MSTSGFTDSLETNQQADLLEHPFDLSVIPANLEVEDSLAQSRALEAVDNRRLADQDEDARFHAQPPRLIPLHYLRRLYENNDTSSAIKLLNFRHQVTFLNDAECVTPSDSNSVSWTVNKHFIDMLVCVGKDIGLGAIIPNQRINSLFSIQMDFRHGSKEFKAKNVMLGFDSSGCMLWIGKTPSSDDIWMAWVPEDLDETNLGLSTCLSQQHYRIVIMFFAFVLSKCRYRDIVVHVQYPDLSNRDAFCSASNLL
jgi:hypothetical protein